MTHWSFCRHFFLPWRHVDVNTSLFPTLKDMVKSIIFVSHGSRFCRKICRNLIHWLPNVAFFSIFHPTWSRKSTFPYAVTSVDRRMRICTLSLLEKIFSDPTFPPPSELLVNNWPHYSLECGTFLFPIVIPLGMINQSQWYIFV